MSLDIDRNVKRKKGSGGASPLIMRLSERTAREYGPTVRVLPEDLQRRLDDLEGMRRERVLLPEDDRELTAELDRDIIEWARRL